MNNRKIRVVLTGDFCPTEHVSQKLRVTSEASAYFGNAVNLVKSADLAITNLEYPVTTSGTKNIKYGSHQKGDPSSIAILQDAGFNLISLANNHIMDYGTEGLIETIRTCESNGLDIVGAGINLQSAQKIYYKDVKGVRVAVISTCEHEFSVASKNEAGAAPFDLVDISNQIQDAKSRADIVIVIIHGGNEFSHFPSPRIVKQYRFLASAGASVVVGHHPHYIQGYEVYKGVPILYSLGKLFYTKMRDPHILEVPIAILDFDTLSNSCLVQYKFYKISLENLCLEELSIEEEQLLRNRFDDYCYSLSDDEKLNAEWESYCRRYEPIYLANLTLVPLVIFRLLRRLNKVNWIKRYAEVLAKRLIIIEDFIRCESHRDAVLFILGKMRSDNVDNIG